MSYELFIEHKVDQWGAAVCAFVARQPEEEIVNLLGRYVERAASPDADTALSGLLCSYALAIGMRDNLRAPTQMTWNCGCGHTNGCNLNICAACGRKPGAKE